MDYSLLLAALALFYVGAILYLANQADLEQSAPRVDAAPYSLAEALARRQRELLLRWMLYGMVSMNLVFAIALAQALIVGQAGGLRADTALPPVDVGAGTAALIAALACSLGGWRLVGSPMARRRLKRLTGTRSLYNPDSSVHTAASVLALTFLAATFTQLALSGGVSGLASNLEAGGVSVNDVLFQAVLLTAAALLGVGLAIRRTPTQVVERLGLRLPTPGDWGWGTAVGLGLYLALIAMVTVWALLVPPEQMAEQSAAAEQIARAFSTLPAAFLLALTASVSEEILFRGALQPVFGLSLTSVFFALVHMQYALTPAAFIILVVALGLGWLRQRQSTSSAIIAHFIYNFVQLAVAILAAGVLTGRP